MDIEKLEPGRELDTLVAERVMGLVPCDAWQRLNSQTDWLPNGLCEHGPCYPRHRPVHYSRKWGGAGQVVEKLRKAGDYVMLESDTEGWCCTICRVETGWVTFERPTGPHAISLTALAAMEANG